MKIIFFTFLTMSYMFATINLAMQKTKIFDVDKTTATINIANLTTGQSGVILKKTSNNTIIIKHATIINSDNNQSTLTFTNTKILEQSAIPTSSLVPSNGDIFVLNHLYNTSLLLVPNTKAKKIVQKLYPEQNFLNEDFFAAHLKLLNNPVPQKEDIVNFSQNQQIGTLFIVIENDLFILDASTFTVIDTITIKNDDTTQNVPFLSKITQIERGFWDFGPDKIDNYNRYYSQLLEIK